MRPLHWPSEPVGGFVKNMDDSLQHVCSVAVGRERLVLKMPMCVCVCVHAHVAQIHECVTCLEWGLPTLLPKNAFRLRSSFGQELTAQNSGLDHVRGHSLQTAGTEKGSESCRSRSECHITIWHMSTQRGCNHKRQKQHGEEDEQAVTFVAPW